MAEVDVGVTRQEHADETLEATPSQFETKVGSGADADDAMYVGQNFDTADGSWIICLKQLSWLQFGGMIERVAETIVVGVGVVDVESFL